MQRLIVVLGTKDGSVAMTNRSGFMSCLCMVRSSDYQSAHSLFGPLLNFKLNDIFYFY